MAGRFDHKNEDYSRLEASALAVLAGYALSLRRGEIWAGDFAKKVKGQLATWHPEAASIGRAAAGGEAGISDLDREMGEAAAKEQGKYLDGFAEDIDAGRYDDEMQGDVDPLSDVPSENEVTALGSRLELYGMALLGTAMAGFVKQQPKEVSIIWATDSNPCDDCNRIAAGNPYTPETLPTYPAAGDTSCLSRCRCSLEVE